MMKNGCHGCAFLGYKVDCNETGRTKLCNRLDAIFVRDF